MFCVPDQNIIIAIGCSQGGVEALIRLVQKFDLMWRASILITSHIGRRGSSLPQVLQRHSELAVSHARNDSLMVPNHIYIAPPDYHLCTLGDRLKLSHGPTENWSRPAIDPMFRSVAGSHGRGVIGILLSGRLDDGVSGLIAIQSQGGQTIVQNPTDALVPDMPEAALKRMTPTRVASIREIPGAIESCVEARR
nr:chemotaxis protein CheB [Bradyrhizobium sp. 199]